VLIVDTWHHIDARPAYAAKLHKALKSGGLVVIVDFTMEATHGPPKEHRVLPEKVVEELKAAGLSAQIATESLPEQYVVIGARGST
jgi:predicted methyltransferase